MEIASLLAELGDEPLEDLLDGHPGRRDQAARSAHVGHHYAGLARDVAAEVLPDKARPDRIAAAGTGARIELDLVALVELLDRRIGQSRARGDQSRQCNRARPEANTRSNPKSNTCHQAPHAVIAPHALQGK